MLRELIDITVLEDFISGLAYSSGLRISVYGAKGELIGASQRGSKGGAAGPVPRQLPQRLEFVNLLPVREPPAAVAFVEHQKLWTIVVPVHVGDDVAGFVGAGVFREPRSPSVEPDLEHAEYLSELPRLERVGDSRPVEIARWAARLLSDWCESGVRLDASAEELSFLRTLGELLSEEKDPQTLLNRIVRETARVMDLQYCSLRLYDPKNQELTVKAGYNVLNISGSEDTFVRAENPTDDAALRGQLVYVEDATVDTRPRFAREAKRLGIVSGLAAGMFYLGEPIGVLRVYADHKRRFTTRQRNLLRTVAAQAAIAVVNARLLEARVKAATTERQLETAGQVQTRMVLTPPPQHPQIESALVFEPSSHVSGDFCDIFTLGDGRLAAVVGDVVGHGVPAALVMASARGALRAAARNTDSLVELMHLLNEHICRETTPSEFVTLLIVAVAPDARRLDYINAGHESLLLLRAGEIRATDQAGLVLGIDPEERYEEHSLEIRPGDFVLLYTDGVVEAMDFEGRIFGRPRIHQALKLYGDMRPDQALRNILWDVRRYVGLAEQTDDLTMVGLRVRSDQSAAGERNRAN